MEISWIPLYIYVPKITICMCRSFARAWGKVDVLNKRGESPLYQASCLPNRIDIVELMLSYGANQRIHTNSGNPLHAACVAGEAKYIIELVKNGQL